MRIPHEDNRSLVVDGDRSCIDSFVSPPVVLATFDVTLRYVTLRPHIDCLPRAKDMTNPKRLAMVDARVLWKWTAFVFFERFDNKGFEGYCRISLKPVIGISIRLPNFPISPM